MKFLKKQSKKKKLKGMTLMEIIIAMVILVILSALIAEAGSGIVSNIRTSKSVVEKVNYQSKFVASKSGTTAAGTVSLELSDDYGSSTSPITANIFEAPTDTDAIYSSYDRAGNLKYFVD